MFFILLYHRNIKCKEAFLSFLLCFFILRQILLHREKFFVSNFFCASPAVVSDAEDAKKVAAQPPPSSVAPLRGFVIDSAPLQNVLQFQENCNTSSGAEKHSFQVVFLCFTICEATLSTFLLAGLDRVLIGLDHLLKHDTRTNSIRKQDFKKSFKSFVHSALYIPDHSRR